MSDTRVWYYVEDNAKVGPHQHAELVALVSGGRIKRDSLVWAEGMANWEAAEAHFEFSVPTPPDIGFSSSEQGGSLPPPITEKTAEIAPHPGLEGQTRVGKDGLYVNAPSRDFGEAIKVCFNKYATFAGRASRSEYWFFALFMTLVSLASYVLDDALFGYDYYEYGPINTVATLALLIPGLAVSWRRLHDTNRSGWWLSALGIGIIVAIFLSAVVTWSYEVVDAFYILITFSAIGYLVLLTVFFCTKGDLQRNRFG